MIKLLLALMIAVCPGMCQISGNISYYGDVVKSAPSAYPAFTPSHISHFTIANPSGGDTQYFTWTTAATKAGNWSGGALVGQYNDGAGFGCVASLGAGGRSICAYEMTAYNAGTSSATMAVVNDMVSYGAYAAQSCYDAVNQMKSRTPVAFDGVLLLPIFCMGGPSDSFRGYASGLIVSPDGGAHWCNYNTFNTHSGSPGCDSSNWQSGGDNPTSSAGFQWPLADGSNKMTRMQIVDFLCQDNTTSCPTAAGVNSAYLYFITAPTSAPPVNGGTAYVIRVLKSVGWEGVMDPSNYEAYASGSWTSTLQNATDVSGGVNLETCCSTYSYLGDYGLFVAWIHTGTTSLVYSTAPTPWGPWSPRSSFSTSGLTTGFPAAVPGLCPKYDTPGRVTCTIASSPSLDLSFIEVDLGGRM